MSSPDFRAYIPLAPFGRSAADVALSALQDLATKLPGVTLLAGEPAVELTETLAVVVADLGLAVDRVPAVTAQVILRLFGVTYDAGGKATTAIDFVLIDTLGHTIPAGTEITVALESGATAVFATDEDLVIAPASSTGTVDATATTIGASANGIAAGTAVRVRSGATFVQSATLDSEIANGRDPETDDAYYLRAAQRLARLSAALVLAEHFTAAALEDINVARALTIDRYDGAGGPPYTDNGHITVIVRGPAGNLTSPQKTALEADLEAKAVGGLVVHILDPTITTVDVEVEVALTAGADPDTVEAAVEAAIEAWLDPAAWLWSATVRYFDAVAIIEGVPGVDHIVAGTLELNGTTADVALAGDGPLAAADTITVTVA